MGNSPIVILKELPACSMVDLEGWVIPHSGKPRDLVILEQGKLRVCYEDDFFTCQEGFSCRIFILELSSRKLGIIAVPILNASVIEDKFAGDPEWAERPLWGWMAMFSDVFARIQGRYEGVSLSVKNLMDLIRIELQMAVYDYCKIDLETAWMERQQKVIG